jgi:hypothetical protein
MTTLDINNILNKSIFDYLNDKYNNQKIVYEKQLEVLKNTKIKDIRLKCFTDSNGNIITFDIHDNNNQYCKIDNNFTYQRLEEFKWIFNDAPSNHVITCRINEIIKSHYCRNILSSVLYGITGDDLMVPIDIDMKSLGQYENNKNLTSKVKKLLIKVNSQDDVIESLIMTIENQEKQIKELSIVKPNEEETLRLKVERLEKLIDYNESKNHYKFIYFFYTFVICFIFKII